MFAFSVYTRTAFLNLWSFPVPFISIQNLEGPQSKMSKKKCKKKARQTFILD